MSLIEQYNTIKGFAENIYKEKGSEFIARAFPVITEDEINNILNDIKKEHYDATHHCYAVRLLNNYIKYSDDGEPSGTAGLRILNAIDHYALNAVFVVVIRYFGGTKLGIGPLGKAYYEAAELVLEKSQIITKHAYCEIIIKTDFTLVSQVHRAFSLFKAKIIKTDYLDMVSFSCLVPPSQLEELQKFLTEVSKGSAKLETTGKTLFL